MKQALIACALALAGCGAPEGVSLTAPQRMTPASLPAFFDCLRERDAVMVSAHRGGPAPGYPENAIATFEHTLARAPVFLEVDVARTRDDELVLMHDDDVARTTNGEGAVSSLALEQFRALRLRDEDGRVLEQSPPSLRETLNWAAGRAVLELDVKQSVRYEDVVAEVRAANAMHRVVFITYSPRGAIRLARLAPEAVIYTTIERAGDLDLLEQSGVDLDNIVAWLGVEGVNVRLLAALNDRGVEARIGQFGRAADFASAARAGVEGVSVNDPAGAYRVFDAADDADGYEAVQCLGVE